jgi:hypothetical protein
MLRACPKLECAGFIADRGLVCFPPDDRDWRFKLYNYSIVKADAAIHEMPGYSDE